MKASWSESPFCALTPCLALGIAAAGLVRQYSFALLTCASLLAAAAALLALVRNRPRASLSLALSCVVLGGLLVSLARRDSSPDLAVRTAISRNLIPLGQAVTFEACVDQDTVRRDTDTVTLLELRGLKVQDQWKPLRGTVPLRLAADTLSISSTSGSPWLRQGDRIRGWARFDLPRNFHNPGAIDYADALNRRGIFLTARARSPRLLEILPGDCAIWWSRPAAAVRRHVRQRLEDLGHAGMRRPSAVLACIVLGDDSKLDSETLESFQNSGTYHVLVVSGMHVAWLSWAVACALRLMRVPAAAARILAGGGILMYAQVVGFQASVSRCLWMFALYMFGQAVFRRAPPVNIVMASAFALVALRSEWLSDVGFQLSFLSVLAIVWMGAPAVSGTILPLFVPLRHAGDVEHLTTATGFQHKLGRRIRILAELAADACEDRYGRRAARSALWCLAAIGQIALAVAALIWMSFAVQIWLTPTVAYYFNRLSWIVPLANLIAVPLSSLVLAAGILGAAACACLLPLSWAYGPATWLASLLLSATDVLGTVPGGWQRCPTPPAGWVLSAVLLLSAWSFLGWRAKWVPSGFVALQAGLLAFGSVPGLQHARQPSLLPGSAGAAQNTAATLEITILDVGQGDCVFIRTPACQVWVVDAGGTVESLQSQYGSRRLDIGETVVSRFLWFRWVTGVDRLFASHAHGDHIGGMPALMRNFPVAELHYPGAQGDAGMKPLLGLARTNGIHLNPLVSPLVEDAGGARIELLHPPGSWQPGSTNDVSLVLRLRHGRFSALLTGDLDGAGESQLISQDFDLRSVLLKVPHHGSRSATGPGLLDRVRPRWAVISAGRNNPFGNPSAETLQRLIGVGARPMLTADHGAITLVTDGNRYTLRSHRRGLLESGELAP